MLKSLLKREIKEYYLKRKIVFIVLIVNVVFLSFYFANFFSRTVKNILILKILINVLPIFLITLFSYILLTEPIYSDKKNKSLEVFFSLSFSPFDVWLSKFIVASIVVITLYYISIILGILINLYTKSGIFLNKLSFSDITVFLVLSPLFALSLTGLIAMLFFIIKDPRILFFFIFFGSYLFFTLIRKFIQYIPLSIFKTTNLILFYIVSTLIIFTFIYFYFKKMKKERWI